MKTNQKFMTLQDKLCIRFLPSKNGVIYPVFTTATSAGTTTATTATSIKNGFPVGTLMEEDTSEPIATLTSSNNFCKAVSTRLKAAILSCKSTERFNSSFSSKRKYSQDDIYRNVALPHIVLSSL